MIYADVLVWSMIAPFAIWPGGGWARMLLENYANGELRRERLRMTAMRTRFVRMLERLQIDTPAYFSQASIRDIEAQLRNCSVCGNKLLCDRDVKPGELCEVDFSFCPNREFLEKLIAAGQVKQAPTKTSVRSKKT